MKLSFFLQNHLFAGRFHQKRVRKTAYYKPEVKQGFYISGFKQFFLILT